jgi:hypothetical protein
MTLKKQKSDIRQVTFEDEQPYENMPSIKQGTSSSEMDEEEEF